MPYKCRRGTVPDRITPGLKSGAQPAGREGRRIRFTLDQLFSGKTHQDFSTWKRCCDKTVMLFCSNSRKRLKPVCIMCCPFFYSPLLHFMGNHISHLRRQFFPLQNRLFQILVNLFRQTLLHDSVIKHVLSKNFSYVCILAHMFFLSLLCCPILHLSQAPYLPLNKSYVPAPETRRDTWSLKLFLRYLKNR